LLFIAPDNHSLHILQAITGWAGYIGSESDLRALGLLRRPTQENAEFLVPLEADF
jgi:hypothetical protein